MIKIIQRLKIMKITWTNNSQLFQKPPASKQLLFVIYYIYKLCEGSTISVKVKRCAPVLECVKLSVVKQIKVVRIRQINKIDKIL